MSHTKQFSRPKSIKEMHERMQDFATTEGWQRAMEYTPSPTDVFIVTPPKCGTTWMQTIVGMLMLDRVELGAPISAISPWLDMHGTGTTQPGSWKPVQKKSNASGRLLTWILMM